MDLLKFYVLDTGSGIPEARLEHVFDRFVQSEDNLSRSHEGSGLGLSIAKAYAELLGGHIKVESEVNKGSVFSVYLPL
jgi:signal transduction histidine kinase